MTTFLGLVGDVGILGTTPGMLPLVLEGLTEGALVLTHFRYSSEILDAALDAAREKIDGTSEYEGRALTALNRVYREIWNGGSAYDPDINEDWHWIRSANPGVIILKAYKTGTCSVTNGDGGVTVVTGDVSLALANWYFTIDGEEEYYKITTHLADSSSITLDSEFVGTTNSGATYRAYKLNYALPTDFKEFVGHMRAYSDSRTIIKEISQKAMDEDYPLQYISDAIPKRYTRITNEKVRFSNYVSEDTRVEFDYLALQSDLTDSDSEQPAVPIQWRHVLVDLTAYHLLLDKEDTAARDYLEYGRATLRAMAKSNREELARMGDLGHIFPRSRRIAPVKKTQSGIRVL